MALNEPEYFRRKAAEERGRASSGQDETEADVHRTIAEMYDRLAARLDQKHARFGDGCAPDYLVFSSRGGQVWVNWFNGEEEICLGREEHVSEMMADFLAQVALGKRLAG